ncbi:MAG TPA: NUDIX domain-containing protein [Candidatus Tectomicrobia bacterium]
MDARTGTAQTLQHRQLRTFRDGRGESVTTWPKGPYPRPSTTVIVLHEQCWLEGKPWQVLCQQRADNGWWGFPGGGQECGESLAECARREVLEETGYLVLISGAVCGDSDPTVYACCVYKDGTVQYANTTFLARVQSGTLRTSEESTQVGWFSTDALPGPFLLSHRWRLEKAMAHRGAFLPVR